MSLKPGIKKALRAATMAYLRAVDVGALNRSRTDDPILTMDVLYLLSYEGGNMGRTWSG